MNKIMRASDHLAEQELINVLRHNDDKAGKFQKSKSGLVTYIVIFGILYGSFLGWLIL